MKYNSRMNYSIVFYQVFHSVEDQKEKKCFLLRKVRSLEQPEILKYFPNGWYFNKVTGLEVEN